MATNSTPLTVVSMNNGSVTTQASGAGIRRILITPLGQPGQMSTQLVPPVIDKVLLTAAAKTGKKKDKLFILYRINTSQVCMCDELKKLIKKQLCDNVIAWEEFDVGYINKWGEKVISIRSAEDLLEVWNEIKVQGDRVQLWCDGLKSGQREE